MAKVEVDLYAVLGVAPTATPEQIKSGYRAAARETHHDGHQPTADRQAAYDARFHLVQQAYQVLSDPAQRAAYDKERAGPGPTPGGGLFAQLGGLLVAGAAMAGKQVLLNVGEVALREVEQLGEAALRSGVARLKKKIGV